MALDFACETRAGHELELWRRSAGKPANSADQERMHQDGVLYSSGLITGEALMGIVVAFFVWKFKDPDVMALPAQFHFGEWAGVVLFAILGVLLYRTAIEGARRVCGKSG